MTVVDQSASGPGTVVPFFNDSPDNPQTPYEFFSQTPGFTGSGAQAQFHTNVDYTHKKLRFVLNAGAESYAGSGPNILFLGEPILPTANPFVTSRTQFFHSYLGILDEVGASRASLINGSVGASDGSWNVTGGWFLPSKTLPFVFTPPPLPDSPPAIAPQLPENPNSVVASLENWNENWPALPLQGVDVSMQRAAYSAGFFDGALPNVYVDPVFGNSARAESLFFGVHGGHGHEYAVQAVRLNQNVRGGVFPISAGVMWGGSLETGVGPEGPLPESDVFGQRSTIVGISANVPLSPRTTALAEFARSWFSAQHFSAPGRCNAGRLLPSAYRPRVEWAYACV